MINVRLHNNYSNSCLVTVINEWYADLVRFHLATITRTDSTISLLSKLKVVDLKCNTTEFGHSFNNILAHLSLCMETTNGRQLSRQPNSHINDMKCKKEYMAPLPCCSQWQYFQKSANTSCCLFSSVMNDSVHHALCSECCMLIVWSHGLPHWSKPMACKHRTDHLIDELINIRTSHIIYTIKVQCGTTLQDSAQASTLHLQVLDLHDTVQQDEWKLSVLIKQCNHTHDTSCLEHIGTFGFVPYPVINLSFILLLHIFWQVGKQAGCQWCHQTYFALEQSWL